MNFYIVKPDSRLQMFNFYRGKFLPKYWIISETKKLKQYEATKNDPEKAIEQPVYGKTTVIRLILEVLRYTCGYSDPLGTLTEKQRSIHLDLPSVFTTR